MNCQTCRLPLNVQTKRHGHKRCWTCRSNQTRRERANDRKAEFSQAATGRIVGEALAKFYKLPTAEHGDRT